MNYDIPDRPASFLSGITTEYKGFTISDTFTISKDGYPVNFPRCWTLDACKRMVDASIECKARQVDMGKALRSLWGSCELENGQTRIEYETEQINNYHENLLREDER